MSQVKRRERQEFLPVDRQPLAFGMQSCSSFTYVALCRFESRSQIYYGLLQSLSLIEAQVVGIGSGVRKV